MDLLPVEIILAFMLTSLLLSLAPGPDNLFVLTLSALYGKRAGICVTLGLCTGLGAHTAAVALGVAVLFQASTFAFHLLKLLGVFYLLYLAWQAFRAGHQTSLTLHSLPSAAALYRRGIFMNLTNPKIAIFFLAFLPQFAAAERGDLGLQLILLGAIFILMALLVFVTIAWIAAYLGQWLQKHAQAERVLNTCIGLLLVTLALRLAVAESV